MTYLLLWILLIIGLLSFGMTIYRSIERDEMRQLNLDLLRAEYGATFENQSEELTKTLFANYLGLHRKDSIIKNVLRLNFPCSQGAIFDTHSYRHTPTAPAGDFKGIWVEFKFQQVPSFKISQRWLLRRSKFSSISVRKLPTWLPHSLAVVAHKEQEDDVIAFLQANPQLEEVLTHPSFVKMFFRGSHLALYYSGFGDPMYNHFEPMFKQFKQLSLLTGASTAPADSSIDIRLLKSATN